MPELAEMLQDIEDKKLTEETLSGTLVWWYSFISGVCGGWQVPEG